MPIMKCAVGSLSHSRVMALVLVFLAGAGSGSAADWPMWRCDAGRTAATQEELPATLQLQWTRHYPPLEPAWSGVRDLSWTKEIVGLGPDRSIGFEVVYSPVVLGKTLFVGSSRNDTVTAIDVETGAEKWRFYTGGPVRLAPAACNGRVYAASDDGFLYCLDAGDGTLVWKFSGAPMKHRIIGDEKLVSAWPARGGPALSDGKVFFAAGIFPFMEVYIYTVDAETGRMIWVNNELGTKWDMKTVQTAPQGPLAVVGDKVLVPNNRLSVTCLDKETGKFIYHRPQSSHWRVCGTGDRFFLEGRGGRTATVHDLNTGNAMAQIPTVPVLNAGLAYWTDPYNSKLVVAGDLAGTEPVDGNVKGKAQANIPSLWSFKPKGFAGKSFEVKVKAGSRLYVSGGKRIVAVDLPREGSEARETWSAEVQGDIGEALAADGRLFVVTVQGGIYCFGAEQAAPSAFKPEHSDLPSISDEWTKKAARILKSSGVKNGNALVLGVGSGRLMEELVRQSELMVIGVDPDAKRADLLRRKLDAAGLYGKRAQIIESDPLDCGLPPYLSSLTLFEDIESAGAGNGRVLAESVFRSLRPYGGTAWFPADRVPEDRLNDWVKSEKLANAQVHREGEYACLTRAGSLPGSASWTHQFADAGNTLCSTDDLVRAPLGLLWFGGPSTDLAFDRHYCGPRPHVAGGRLFVFGHKGLTAIDVYSGRLLWQTTSPEMKKLAEPYLPAGGNKWDLAGANLLGSPFVSLTNGVYVAGGNTCVRLDPATGEKTAEIRLPSAGPHAAASFGPIRIWGDILVAAAAPFGEGESGSKGNKLQRMASRRILAFDRNTGKALWSLAAEQGFCHNAIAAGAGKVFCMDRWSSDPEAAAQGGRLLALDARTGEKVWSTAANVFGSWLAYSSDNHVLLQGGYGARSSRESRAIAYEAETGKVLWDGKAGIGPWMLNGNMIINQNRSAVDIRTGKVLKSFKRLDGKSCDYDIGGTHIITDREFSAAYLDIGTGATYRLGGIRSGCMNTLIPADGVLSYAYFASGCCCGLNIRTSMGLIHMPELAVKR